MVFRGLFVFLVGLWVGPALAAETAPAGASDAGLVTLAALENAVEETSASAGPAHIRTIAALGLLENQHRQTGAYTDAEITFQRIVAAERSLLPETHRSLAPLMAYLVVQSAGTKRSAARTVRAVLGDVFGPDNALRRTATAHLTAVRLARDGVLAKIERPVVIAARNREISQAAAGSVIRQTPAEPENALYHIQFAALRNPSRAVHLKFLEDISRAHGDLLGATSMKTLPTDFGPDRGVLYRLMAGPMTEARGRALCHRLAERNQDCFLVQPRIPPREEER